MPEADPPIAALADLSPGDIARLASRPTPPVERWDPPFCGDSGMRIAADGTWWHEGAPIARAPLVRLFAGLLRREPGGGYVLVTPVEKLAIAVDDLPFVALEMVDDGAGPARNLAFRLNTGEAVVAGPDHPLRLVGDGSPALLVRGALEARIARPVWYELADLVLADEADPLGLWSCGAFFPAAAV